MQGDIDASIEVVRGHAGLRGHVARRSGESAVILFFARVSPFFCPLFFFKGNRKEKKLTAQLAACLVASGYRTAGKVEYVADRFPESCFDLAIWSVLTLAAFLKTKRKATQRRQRYRR